MQGSSKAGTRAADPLEIACPEAHRKGLREAGTVFGVLLLFSILLALVTRAHEIYLDEAQAWLIARHSHNLAELFHNLHYEGHPAVWYLLIYPVAHLSNEISWIRAINYALSVVTAGLILFDRRNPMTVKVLLVFSVFVFFYMGVIARSYMLAGMLLIASARCLLADRPRHWTAMLLLGVAINTHFLAIPLATGIFVWLYWIAPTPTTREDANKIRQRRFWISILMLGIALVLCYLTVRPAADLDLPQYHKPKVSLLGYLLMNIGSMWRNFVILPTALYSPETKQLLAAQDHPSLIAVTLSVLLWIIAIFGLPTRRGKYFFITVSLLWTAATWLTVHIAGPFHVSMLFVGYIIALMMKPADGQHSQGSAPKASRNMLYIGLGMQVLICFIWCIQEACYPYSGGEPTAIWLKGRGFDRRPLVIQPDLAGPAILASAGIESAYYPACHCQGSFLVYRKSRDVLRRVSREELQEIERESGSAPIVISQWKLDAEEMRRLGLRLEFKAPDGWFWVGENVFVYQSTG